MKRTEILRAARASAISTFVASSGAVFAQHGGAPLWFTLAFYANVVLLFLFFFSLLFWSTWRQRILSIVIFFGIAVGMVYTMVFVNWILDRELRLSMGEMPFLAVLMCIPATAWGIAVIIVKRITKNAIAVLEE